MVSKVSHGDSPSALTNPNNQKVSIKTFLLRHTAHS